MKEQKAKWVLRTFGIVVVATFIAFLILKLCGILPWSWWWIFAPLWGAFAITVVVTGLFALIVIAFASSTSTSEK